MSETKKTPVIIISNDSYSLIENSLKSLKTINVVSVKPLSSEKVHSYMEEIFTTKDINKNYGVYLLTEN